MTISTSTISTNIMPATPTLTLEQMQQVRTRMAEQGHSLCQQFEEAGKNVATLAAKLLAEDEIDEDESDEDSFASVIDRPIVILTGRGETGTIGLIAARHLAEQDAWVQVLTLSPPEEHRGLAADALRAMLAADVPLVWADEGWELPPCDLLIDAMSGLDYQVTEGQRSALRPLIELTNSSLATILSIGLPSSTGLLSSIESGNNAHSIFVKATATLSFGLPLTSLQNELVRAASGDLYLADMGIPTKLLNELNISPSPDPSILFASGPIIQL